MLNSFFWILTGGMVARAIAQLLFIDWYRRILRQPDTVNLDSLDLNSTTAPDVAIVLCLRGPDPNLPDCLAGLMNQRYSNFSLHLVVDSDDDPVIPIAKSVLKTIDPSVSVHWRTVADHSSNCSLKCSSLMTTVTSLQSDQSRPDIVAFVDADALVDSDWLSRLVAPLIVPASNVGATTGNRWFEPTETNLGSRFRAAWNAAALPQMQIYQVAWGRSLAMRLETIQQCELLNRWSTAFCEDTMLADVLRTHGLRVRRVPELIVVNQESTTLKSALDWIGRQLLTVRLYYRAWSLILLHALLGGFCFFAPLALAVLTATTNPPVALWATLAWGVQLCFNIGLLEFIRTLNLNAIKKSIALPRKALGIFSKVVVAITLQAVYPFLAIRVAFRRLAHWGGIEYRIGTHGQIEMIDYVPYSQVSQTDQHSIQ